MGLSAGARLGAYEILGPLGAGGMGEVYRARDPRLGREVAIKVLPREWSENPERLRRFEQEGRAASALAHPNILTVHELGTVDGAPYLVTELLEGETLRQRLAQGALAPRKAVELAAQLARGLAAAHERGIVHRDLKPENLFVTSDGRLKVLDFGIARLADGGAVTGALSPTLDLGPGSGGGTTPLPGITTPSSSSETAPGVVLGTLGYMAPEQVRGLPAGPAADLFAFGAVLYEMLAGRRAFLRPTAADTVAAVLTEDPPDLAEAGRPLPPALVLLVRRCLEKRPEERFRSAGDLAFALENLTSVSTGRELRRADRRTHAAPRSLLPLAQVALGVAFAVALFFVGRELGRRAGRASSPVLGAFRQLTDLPGIEHFPNLAPDGQTVAFDSPVAGNHDIYVQRVGGRNPINLTGASEADDRMPAFSPDGGRIAFRSERDGGGIFLMGATGESVRRLTRFGYHPAWTPDGRAIVFSTGAVVGPQTMPASELWVVEIESGASRRLSNEEHAVQPSVSPRGLRVAFWRTASGRRDLATVPFGSSPEAQVVAATDDAATDWAPVWSPDGRWLYFSSDRDGAVHLWRLAIDELSGEPRGEPQSLPGVGGSAGPFSLGRDGRTIVYRAWVDKFDLERLPFDPVGGRATGASEIVMRSTWLANPDVSPDGAWLATNSWRAPVDLWLFSTRNGELRQLTADPERDARPMFSPDGARLAFHSARGGKYEIWLVGVDGSGLERLTEFDDELYFARWAPDGRRLAAAGNRGTYLIDPSTRPARVERLELAGIGEDESFVPWSWSPDGALLLGYLIGPGDDLGDRGIALYRLATGELERLTRAGWSPWMLPDGRRILYLDRISHGQLRLLDLATRREELVLAAPAETPFDVVAPTRDFRTLYFTRSLGEGDLWSATLGED